MVLQRDSGMDKSQRLKAEQMDCVRRWIKKQNWMGASTPDIFNLGSNPLTQWQSGNNEAAVGFK